ncbi:hypothetical protein CVT24_004672 [Panaeolus cyanescens]|uniref:LIM zinc-binding domain-containing protein n=1 Tax=Panaeolus cyanescens TaxID=181874 RepID=A0A409W1E8_9AGAR|nr:hypothetical protein CVT24_004672 [Panaeolus cyanescens]
MAGPSENDAGSSASDRFSCSTYSAYSVDHIISGYDDNDEEIPPVPPLPKIVVRSATRTATTTTSTTHRKPLPRPLPQPGDLKSCLVRKTTVNPILAQSIQNRFTQLERGKSELRRAALLERTRELEQANYHDDAAAASDEGEEDKENDEDEVEKELEARVRLRKLKNREWNILQFHAQGGFAGRRMSVLYRNEDLLKLKDVDGPVGVAATKAAHKNCPACKLPAVGKKGGFVIGCGKTFFHVDCYKCKKCRTAIKIDDRVFIDRDDLPLCHNCFHNCAECHLKISERILYLTDKVTYHPNCFKCRKCKTVLNGKKFGKTTQSIYCVDCFNRRNDKIQRRVDKRLRKEKEAYEKSFAAFTVPPIPPVIDLQIDLLPLGSADDYWNIVSPLKSG